jgi:ATP-dependent DNA helicase PIF1
MNYSQEQTIAFNKYILGENIFITGPGGTGKTALIKYIQKDASRKGYNIQVCALTGCAAVLLDCKAKTLHSWAGIGIGNGTLDRFVTKITKNSFLKSSWKNTDILVVDEVSMMSQKLFELLDSIGKIVRKSSKPFGGIQLIFSGDFYQLPPVGDKEDPETIKFCFESPEWMHTFQSCNHILLTKIFRQSDPIYQKILNQIREGKLRRSSNETLLHLVGREILEEVAIRPTKLFPTRNKVDYINTTEMNKLVTAEYEYKLKYHSDLDMTVTELMKRKQYTKEQIQTELLYLKGNLRCDEVVKIKIGCQVMCIVNIELDNGGMICNGSQGIITRITESGLPVVKYRNSYEMTMNYHVWLSDNIPGIGVSQIPLILAWALTIHKAQGATLDIAEIDAGSGIFECGQTYVALSRVKSLEGLYLTSFDASRIKINRKVQEFYQNLNEINRNNFSEPEIIHETKAEAVQIPIVVATPIDNTLISDTGIIRDTIINNEVRVIHLDNFELLEEDYKK